MNLIVTNKNRIYLTDTSWYDIFTIRDINDKDVINFDELWNIHPVAKGKVKIYGKEIETPRWQQTYGRSYQFTGVDHEALPFPEITKHLKNFVDNLEYGKFNQMLLNWYENGHHYIGAHSDSVIQLIPFSPIISISLGSTRTFRIREKHSKNIIKDIQMPNGTVLVMGGTFQNDFTHEVPKINGKKGSQIERRINITFRQFV